MTHKSYRKPAGETQSRLPLPPGYLASQVDLSGATAEDPPHLNGEQYVEDLLHGKVARDLADWTPEAPENGWFDYWPALGETVAGAHYLEQRAKPHLNRDSERGGWGDDPVKTCGNSAIGRFAMTGTDPTGSHQVAKALVCNLEWCSRCGKNSEPGSIGSDAHQRRIARWLPKAQQMKSMGYFVLTVPEEHRSYFRRPAPPKVIHHKNKPDTFTGPTELYSYIGRNVTRAMKRRGFDRGLRRWHWFGEEENAPEGEAPKYHPHLNVLVEGRYVDLDGFRSIWSKILVNAIKHCFGEDVQIPTVVIHYDYKAHAPGQKYHRIRYVTRSTFKDYQWDEYMARFLFRVRNCQAWGKWEGEALWQPEPKDASPAVEVQAIAVGNCPDCVDGSPIEWSPKIIRAAVIELPEWRHVGAGYYIRDLEPGGDRWRTDSKDVSKNEP